MSTSDFSESNIPQSNWMAFTTVWDIVKWTLTDKYIKTGTDGFPDQTVYVLTKASIGTSVIVDKKVTQPDLEEVGEMNVGISKDFINSRMKSAKSWDIIAFAFVQEIEPSKKGYAKAKSITPFISGVDEEYLAQFKALETKDVEDLFKEDNTMA